jgi:tetratricopeptide (TPR) repeat protein
MSSSREDRPAGRDPGFRERRLEEAFEEYVDRFNAGEAVDPEEIRERHPDIAEELIEGLRAFADFESDTAAEAPLGTLGDYRLVRRIGRGGMGVVYEAWQNSLERQVALKVLPVGVGADDRTFQRFMREARTAAKLHHPHIVGVFGIGIESSTPYYAMEFVDGETLAQVAARLVDAPPGEVTPFGFSRDDVAYPSVVARAFSDVADGLQHAHSKGIIHRDIKPSNLILDRAGRLRILDFGLAHLEGQESLTISGDVVGTPLYMSPEQARRRKIPIDHRTDIYSLGATLYEMIAGRPPFRGKDNQDTLSQIIERDPAEPSKLNRRVPRDLETIVLKCLRKEPADRYGTAEALGQDLRRFVRGDAIEARPQTRWECLMRRLRRHRGRLLLAAAFAVLVLSLASIAYLEQGARRAAAIARYEPAVLAVLRRIQAGQFSLRVVAGESVGVMRFSIRQTPVLAEDFRRLAEAGGSGKLREDVRELERAADAVDRPDGHYHLARAYRLLERTEEARKEALRALECDPDFVPAEMLGIELSEVPEDRQRPEVEKLRSKYEKRPGWQRWWLEAYMGLRDKEWSKAAESYGHLIALGERAVQPYVGSTMEAYLGRGVARIGGSAQRDPKSPLLAIEDFSAARALSPGLEPSLLLGKAYFLSGQREAAEETFERLYGTAGPRENAEAALWVAAVYDSVSCREEGLRWVERLGKEIPARERLRSHFLGLLGRRREAIEAGRRAAQSDPGDPAACRVLASALLADVWSAPGPGRERKLLEAICASRRALDLDPGSAFARLLLGAAGEELRNEVLEHLRRKSMNTSGMVRAVAVFALAVAAPRPAVGQEDALSKGFFDDVRKVEISQPGLVEGRAAISADGLEIVYSQAMRPSNPYRLYLAERDERNEPFSNARICPEINADVQDANASMSADGKDLYYNSDNSDLSATKIMLATRPAPGQCFTAPRPLDEINNHPLVRGMLIVAPAISADGLELYFAAGSSLSPGSPIDLYVATRESTDELLGSKDFRALDEINSLEFQEFWPSISSDGLTLFFSYNEPPYPAGSKSLDIWAATRPDKNSPFGSIQNLGAPVNTWGWEESPAISRDWPAAGSELYFTRGTGDVSTGDLFVATWHIDCNGNRIDDAEEIASGASKDCNTNGIPDECDIASGASQDTNANGIPDDCPIEDLGGLQRPGDANGDGTLDLSDPVWLLEHLFLGTKPYLPCGGGSASLPGAGDLALLDSNGDGGIDISDAVGNLSFLFGGGKPPVLGTGCVRIPGCPETCR